MLTAITGINWGDEGKGRMVDLLCRDYDIVARYQGGDNAGHTVKNECGKFVLNLVPSGILHPNIVCVMGGGMVIDPEHLEKEIAALREQGVKITPDNLKISDRATITMPFHVEQDGLEEARLAKTGAQFGSTKRGIAYTYGDKYMKKTLRMGDLVHMDASVRKRLETLVESKNLTMVNIYNQKPVSVDDMWNWCKHFQEVFSAYICDVGQYLADADDAGKKIMFEAQLGALRDIDYGIYPYTTSSNTIGAYAPIGAGIPGRKLNKSIGIMKAYSSCVGDGPFTTELAMTEEEKLIALKAMVGGSDSDEVLSTYLKLAGRKIINRAYPYDSSVTEVPAQYDTLQCEIAAYMLNKRGAEGQTSHSENGISRSYENADIPSSMLKVVTPHVGVIK